MRELLRLLWSWLKNLAYNVYDWFTGKPGRLPPRVTGGVITAADNIQRGVERKFLLFQRDLGNLPPTQQIQYLESRLGNVEAKHIGGGLVRLSIKHDGVTLEGLGPTVPRAIQDLGEQAKRHQQE